MDNKKHITLRMYPKQAHHDSSYNVEHMYTKEEKNKTNLSAAKIMNNHKSKLSISEMVNKTIRMKTLSAKMKTTNHELTEDNNPMEAENTISEESLNSGMKDLPKESSSDKKGHATLDRQPSLEHYQHYSEENNPSKDEIISVHSVGPSRHTQSVIIEMQYIPKGNSKEEKPKDERRIKRRKRNIKELIQKRELQVKNSEAKSGENHIQPLNKRGIDALSDSKMKATDLSISFMKYLDHLTLNFVKLATLKTAESLNQHPHSTGLRRAGAAHGLLPASYSFTHNSASEILEESIDRGNAEYDAEIEEDESPKALSFPETVESIKDSSQDNELPSIPLEDRDELDEDFSEDITLVAKHEQKKEKLSFSTDNKRAQSFKGTAQIPKSNTEMVKRLESALVDIFPEKTLHNVNTFFIVFNQKVQDYCINPHVKGSCTRLFEGARQLLKAVQEMQYIPNRKTRSQKDWKQWFSTKNTTIVTCSLLGGVHFIILGCFLIRYYLQKNAKKDLSDVKYKLLDQEPNKESNQSNQCPLDEEMGLISNHKAAKEL
ncbi:uncharacterized protein LOC122796695 [Protopterus annectens]|uniref:uncharacterized protein LOC122796695 n=1 Tax=Protopterus annectens TaxID=7888 RepID=UPI001CF9C888|nr:uncharacterized protein LOC122796695 [Protopterus annectens]XP_043921320.1 uncharacterized protein LOC122796695 [Protopterus annectens]XP_043921321.1 uncharacterized protein LOC122796695 [Protopterus annectens]